MPFIRSYKKLPAIFAVPENTHSIFSSRYYPQTPPNQHLKSPIPSQNDPHSAIHPASKRRRNPPVTDLSLDEKILYDALGTDESHIDDLISRSGLTPATVSATLMRLEMKRLLKPLPGRHYVRLI